MTTPYVVYEPHAPAICGHPFALRVAGRDSYWLTEAETTALRRSIADALTACREAPDT